MIIEGNYVSMSRANIKLLSFLIIVSILCNGCFTPMLWEATDPDKNVQINGSEITEAELKLKGVKYFKGENSQYYFVEKDSTDKAMDYTYRILGTPVTAALDVGSSLFILIGFMVSNNEIDKAKERAREAEVTKYGYRSESFPLPK